MDDVTAEGNFGSVEEKEVKFFPNNWDGLRVVLCPDKEMDGSCV